MTPVSVLDSDFDQKIAALPHDEAKASFMEHAVRAQINERLAANPAYFERLSAQLSHIIEELRNRLIDDAEPAAGWRNCGAKRCVRMTLRQNTGCRR